MTPGAVGLILLQRALTIEPRLFFEAEDHMLTASWPTYAFGGNRTYTSIVAFTIEDGIKLLRHVLARLDERANHG